jgi:hypothetical protein
MMHLLLMMLAGAMAFGGLVMPAALAQTDADEARLQTVAKSIDKDTANKADALKVQTLAKQFNVPDTTVEDLRSKKQGWGNVTIELAMAQHLAQTDPKTYPTLNDALQKIAAMRTDKMGWGKIGKELGFKLGPVVSAAEHTRQDLFRDLRAERVQKAEKVEKQERVERPDRPQRPERPDRPEKLHRQ